MVSAEAMSNERGNEQRVAGAVKPKVATESGPGWEKCVMQGMPYGVLVAHVGVRRALTMVCARLGKRCNSMSSSKTSEVLLTNTC